MRPIKHLIIVMEPGQGGFARRSGARYARLFPFRRTAARYPSSTRARYANHPLRAEIGFSNRQKCRKFNAKRRVYHETTLPRTLPHALLLHLAQGFNNPTLPLPLIVLSAFLNCTSFLCQILTPLVPVCSSKQP